MFLRFFFQKKAKKSQETRVKRQEARKRTYPLNRRLCERSAFLDFIHISFPAMTGFLSGLLRSARNDAPPLLSASLRAERSNPEKNIKYTFNLYKLYSTKKFDCKSTNISQKQQKIILSLQRFFSYPSLYYICHGTVF